MHRLLLSLIISCSLFSAIAQNVLPIGSWRSHLPYRQGRHVAQSSTKAYFATRWSVLILDKEERSVEFLSKVDGLSNAGINLLQFNPASEILIVVYDNSVIDLVKPDEIITLNQILNFANFTGEKRINDVFVESDSTIYISATFGVSKINISANEFMFTTFTGVEVLSTAVFNNNIYIATEEGIYRTAVNNINPDDFGNWEFLDSKNGFPEDYSTKEVTPFNESLYFDMNDVLYRLGADGPELVHEEAGQSLRYLTAEGQHLLAGYRNRALYFNPDHSFGVIAGNCLGDPLYGIEDAQGRVWFGDNFRGFRFLNQITDSSCELVEFNSPLNSNNREITVQNNQVWIAAGGVNQTFSNLFSPSGFYSLVDGNWSIYNRNNQEVIKGEDPNDSGDDLLDFLTIAIHPVNGTIYAGSFYEGLIEFDGETMILYNDKNSTLSNAISDVFRTRVSGLVFDQDNNLWVSNHSASNPLSVLKSDGSWQTFNLSCNQREIHQIDVDQSGFKWTVTGGNQSGVLVFDSGNLDDNSDDRCRLFTSNNSNLPTNDANCLVADLDGDVWVGTTEGVIIFECGGSAFEPECQGSRRIVEQDGFGAFLLETEDVLTIAVDGANRKWVGTRNGIFVLSESGEKEIARFTENNSPLFDNTVIDIAVNQENGEVFIGTNKGVQSYQADAVLGESVNRSNILVFPNPVRPEYDGPIAIRGLAQNANVKITDISGKLVFETESLGGQAIWDGRDYNGRRVNSGIYLVFSTSDPRFSGLDNPDAAVAKVLVMN